jgi:hypothetical protein
MVTSLEKLSVFNNKISMWINETLKIAMDANEKRHIP